MQQVKGVCQVLLNRFSENLSTSCLLTVKFNLYINLKASIYLSIYLSRRLLIFKRLFFFQFLSAIKSYFIIPKYFQLIAVLLDGWSKNPKTTSKPHSVSHSEVAYTKFWSTSYMMTCGSIYESLSGLSVLQLLVYKDIRHLSLVSQTNCFWSTG